MKRLIINADDFGQTSGVNQAILELNQRRSLTSATLMANAAATEEAIQLTQSQPTLGVGCHVVLLDGLPITSIVKLPGLTHPRTLRFASTLNAFLSRLIVRGREIEPEIEAETASQLSRLQSRGLNLTHIDTHKHTHMFPRVLRPVLRAAKRAGIQAVRNPFEPDWSLKATVGAPWIRRTQVKLLRTFQSTFLRIVAEEGFTTTDGAIGVLATGTLDAATLASLLRAMPDGTWELVTHPGYNDAQLAQAGTRLLASREVELHALSTAIFNSDIELIHFGNLTRKY